MNLSLIVILVLCITGVLAVMGKHLTQQPSCITIPIEKGPMVGDAGHFLVPTPKGHMKVRYMDGIVTELWIIEDLNYSKDMEKWNYYQIWPIDWWMEDMEEFDGLKRSQPPFHTEKISTSWNKSIPIDKEKNLMYKKEGDTVYVFELMNTWELVNAELIDTIILNN